MAPLDAIRQAKTATEYSNWEHQSLNDWLTGVCRTRPAVEIFSKYFNGPLTLLPPPILRNGWEAHYRAIYYEGNRTVDVNRVRSIW